MKKILAAVLCLAMLISTMGFAVVAEEVKTDRKIYLEVTPAPTVEIDGVDYTEVEMDDIVTVSVKIDGDGLSNALWELNYKTEHFELLTENADDDNDGIIEGKSVKQTGVYASGDTLDTYQFKVKGQNKETETAFSLSNTQAYTWMESWDGGETFLADCSEPANVLIKLIPYEVTVKVDGNVVTGNTCEPIPYDNDKVDFEVITKPTATVEIEYELNGQPVSEIKAEGTYKITYTVEDNETGYDKVYGEFTLVISKPDYVVEVNLAQGREGDYVAGKKLVLVYTNTAGFGFKYDGNPMINVSENNYTYYDDPNAGYTFTYAFVTDRIEDGTKLSYENLVKHDYDIVCETLKADDYDEDVNMDGYEDIRDVTSAYGVLNVFPDYYTTAIKDQKKILNVDIDNDKFVRDEEVQALVTNIFAN